MAALEKENSLLTYEVAVVGRILKISFSACNLNLCPTELQRAASTIDRTTHGQIENKYGPGIFSLLSNVCQWFCRYIRESAVIQKSDCQCPKVSHHLTIPKQDEMWKGQW